MMLFIQYSNKSLCHGIVQVVSGLVKGLPVALEVFAKALKLDHKTRVSRVLSINMYTNTSHLD